MKTIKHGDPGMVPNPPRHGLRWARGPHAGPRAWGAAMPSSVHAKHVLFALLTLGLAARAAAEEKLPLTFNFDADKPGDPPKGFEFGRTGEGTPGKWVVQTQKDAPSAPNVLVQTDTDATDYRFPVAFTGPELKDLRLSVKCKAMSGKVDQGCGLVFRLKDSDNYYVTRANALENNVRLYHVVKGSRRQFAGWNGKVPIRPLHLSWGTRRGRDRSGAERHRRDRRNQNQGGCSTLHLRSVPDLIPLPDR